MSFEREGRDIVFLCDGVSCHEVLRTDSDDFSTAVEVAKENNWQIRKEGKEWRHYCPDEEDLGWMQ
jgi:hypothetical protein